MAAGLIDAPAVEEPKAPAKAKKLIDAPAIDEPVASTDQPKALIDAPAVEEPKKPVTIDPGVDVGFGPGVAAPEIDPVTGMPVQAAKPAQVVPQQPAAKGLIDAPAIEEPAAPKPYIMTGVGAVPEEPPKAYKPPVTGKEEGPAPLQQIVSGLVSAGPAGLKLIGHGGLPRMAKPAAAPVEGEQPKAAPQGEQLPGAVTAIAHPDDASAQGQATQVPDQTGNLQPAKFVYSDDDQAKSLAYQTTNKEDLYVRAAKIAADPTIPQSEKDRILQRFAEAATKYTTANEPSGLEKLGRFSGGALEAVLHSPQLADSLARFGVNISQVSGVISKLAIGQEINPQDDAVLQTFMASAEEGGGGAVEMAESLRNWLIQNRPTAIVRGAPADPNQMSWDDINKLSPDQQRAAFISKANWLGQRYQTAAARQRGELDPFWREKFQNLTGHDPNTQASLAKQGVYQDTKAIPGGGLVLSPLNAIFPAGEGLIAKALPGVGREAMATATEAAADAMSKWSKVQQGVVEPWMPAAGRIVGGRGAQAAIATAGLAHLPFPFNLAAFGALGKVRQVGAAIGEKLGQSPQWIRENVWDPAQKIVAEQANDIRYGTNNVLAKYGPAGALIQGAGSALKGAAIAAPFAAGAQTPEEAGGTMAFGGMLGGLHGSEAARDAAFSSLFFRDPEKYTSMGYEPKQYGTNYYGKNFDAAHDAWTSGQSAIDQARINDARGLLPNVEQYHLGNQDFQDAVTHLQNNGAIPPGNQNARGFNIVKDPGTGKTVILVNGDASGGFETAAHEIGHTIYDSLPPETRDAFRNAAFQFNDPNKLAQWYFGNLKGRDVRYMDLPNEAGIANGTQKYLPGLTGYTKEHFVEEMGAETVAALLRGQPLSSFIRDPALFRRAQLAVGTVLNKMGFNVTPEEATTILGIRPGVAQMWIMDKALRDYFKANKPELVPPGGGGGRQGPIPEPKSRQTAATPTPTGGPAQMPPPPPTGGPKVTNNQPEMGGGPTGAPQKEIDDAVKALQGLRFAKRQAQQMVKGASGQTAADLVRSALKNHQIAKERVNVPRTPQEAVQAQPPTPPHPLAAYRDLTSPALLRRATDGDPQAVQALIERHGANWLQAVEKKDPEVAAEFRRKYPEQAAEQDQRIKAGVEAAPTPGAEELPPQQAIAMRAQELSQQRGGAPGHEQEDWLQAERELRQRAIDAAKARAMPMVGEKAQFFPEEEGGGRVFMSPIHGFKQFEIDDRDMTWVAAPEGSGTLNMLDYNWENTGSSALGDIINHPNLFKNYPDLRDLRVEMRPEMRGNGGYMAPIPGEPETILLRSFDLGTLAHEIQHAVQLRENWPGGSNPQRIIPQMENDDAITKDLSAFFNAYYPEAGPTDFKTHNDYVNYIADRSDQWRQWYQDRISRMAFGVYQMSPGEIEARTVGRRAVAPSGWRVPPEEQLAGERAETKARAEEDIRRMNAPPIGMEAKYTPQIPGSKVSFMPDIPAAPKGKKAKAPARVDAPQELRDTLFTPEQKAWLANAQQKAIAAIDQYPETPLSGVRYADGEVPFPEGKMTKAQVATFFDALNSNKLDFRNPEHQKLMADALTHDVLKRLISNPESLGWYNRVLDGAMQEMGRLEPRILQDPIHNMVMRLCMAITSQNQKVHPNFENAYRAYLYWDRTGKLPTDKAYFGGGTKADAMIANFQKINDLIKDHNFDGTAEILKTDISVRDIRDKFKVKIPGEAMNYTSPGSMMLGPKIGSFYNNLSKLYHTLTADLWFTRTMNRMAGRMMGFKKGALIGVEEPEVEGAEEEEAPDEVETGKHQLGKLRDLITTGQIENASKSQQRAMVKEINALEAYRDNPDALDRDKALELSPKIRDWAKAQHKVYQKSTGVNKKGEPLGTYGQKTEPNLLSKNIDLNFQNLTDAPRNGTERENFRDIMKQVQSNLAGVGIDIEHADNQAVLWYLEQDLFARAKGRKAGAYSADYLDAAYALRQKYQGKTPDKFGKVPEPSEATETPAAKPKPQKPRAPPEGPEKIHASAVRFPSGKVYPGLYHSDAFYKGIDAGEPHPKADEEENGYLTSHGRFVGRQEGWELAQAAKQLRKGAAKTQRDEGGLAAEDVKGLGYDTGEAPPSVPKQPRKAKAAAMPEGPAFPKAPRQAGGFLVPPSTALSQAETEERKRQQPLPAAMTALQPEPEVRRGMIVPPQPPPTEQPSQQPSRPSQPPQPSEEPAIDIHSASYQQGRTYEGRAVKPQWIVIHSTDAEEPSSIHTLTQSGVSVHYLSTRDGRLLHFVPEADTAYHAGRDKFGKDGNPASIGIEQVHLPGEPWSDAEVRTSARAAAGAIQRWGIPLNHVIGHSTLAGPRKDDPQDYPWARFYGYVREYLGGGSAPSQPSQPTAAGRPTPVNTAAAHIMTEEGSSGVQDGIPEIFGFRQGQDSEYPALARARASGDEATVRKIATKGLVDRAIATGGQQFSDPAVKAQILSLAHMRGPGGARDILNAVATGKIDNSGSVDHLDPEAVKAINAMPREEVLRRIQIARTVYDQAVHGQDYWNRFGQGLTARYVREKEFYSSL